MTRLLLTTLLASTALAALPARADLELRDPNGILPYVDKFLQAVPFEAAFHCGDQAKVALLHDCTFTCSPDGCGSQCQETTDVLTRTIEDCQPDSVRVHEDLADSHVLTRQDYDALHGNLLRAELVKFGNSLGMAGAIEVGRCRPKPFTLPSGRVIETLEVQARFVAAAGGQSFTLAAVVGRKIPAVAQLLKFSASDEPVYQVTELLP